MMKFPSQRLTDLLKCELPMIQAPMAGANNQDMVLAVAAAGAIGSLPCAMLSPEKITSAVDEIRRQSSSPLNLNFFCHDPVEASSDESQRWLDALAPFYAEYEIPANITLPNASRAPFDARTCEIVEAVRPEIVSFHFGLPEASLLNRVKATGAVILSSATTVAEARWLEDHGADAVIAQGVEAGGHRGMFLNQDINTQSGTFSLVPRIVDAIGLPVIAAGAITDGRGIAAAFALGADGVQIGTAYLFTPEATISPMHAMALENASEDTTTLTNVFSGKPARGIINRVMRELGPVSDLAPAFPTAGSALAPLKKAAELEENADFSSLWSGQSAPLGKKMGATQLTRLLADDALALFDQMSR